MDVFEEIWHGKIYTWPAKITFRKTMQKNKIVGEIRFYDTQKVTAFEGELIDYEGMYHIELKSENHSYSGMVHPSNATIIGVRLQGGKNPCQFTFIRNDLFSLFQNLLILM